MSSKISPELKSRYCFWQVDDTQRKAIPKELMATFYEKEKWTQNYFAQCYKNVLIVLTGTKSEDSLSADEKQLFQALNSSASVRIWKEESVIINDLTSFLKISSRAFLVGSTVPAGMMLIYFRSQKVLALASGCAVCACLVFISMCFKLSTSFDKIYRHISVLDLSSYDQLSQKVDGVYHKLKKSSYLMRFYLEAHESRMNKEHLGLQLLSEQLSAIHHLILMGTKFAFLPNTPLGQLEGQFNLGKIKTFFVKFEMYCRKGMNMSSAIGGIALAMTYYAYVQKAYLMTMVGMVHFLGSLAISHQLFILYRGSKKINGDETLLKESFQEMVSRSFLLRRLGVQKAAEYQIQQAVVIPFDAVLTLMPSWKSKVQNTN